MRGVGPGEDEYEGRARQRLNADNSSCIKIFNPSTPGASRLVRGHCLKTILSRWASGGGAARSRRRIRIAGDSRAVRARSDIIYHYHHDGFVYKIFRLIRGVGDDGFLKFRNRGRQSICTGDSLIARPPVKCGIRTQPSTRRLTAFWGEHPLSTLACARYSRPPHHYYRAPPPIRSSRSALAASAAQRPGVAPTSGCVTSCLQQH